MAGIYLHIPFCKKRCHYCDFYKSLDTGFCGEFVKALKKEAADRSSYIESSDPVETIYFGGGTPSVLSLEQIRDIMEVLRASYNISEDPEVTFEINPDDANRAYLNGLAREGINRLSIGIQSWDDKILKMLNRRHNAKQAGEAVRLAGEAGINNISVDLIYGIPGLDTDEWKGSLRSTFELGVNHISAYHLTIEPNTVFGKMKEIGELKETGEEESEKQFNALAELAEANGYEHYEISNLCRDKHYSKHNTGYWKQAKYIGLGPSAHSYNGYSRQWNIADLSVYLRNIKSGKEIAESETLDDRTRYNEYIMTSLRTIWGVDLEYIEENFTKEIHDYLLNMASRFIKYGMIDRNNNKALVLTRQGKMISDNIISELMMT